MLTILIIIQLQHTSTKLIQTHALLRLRNIHIK